MDIRVTDVSRCNEIPVLQYCLLILFPILIHRDNVSGD